MKKKAYRHGELLLVAANAIPPKAKRVKIDTLHIGSGQNPHKFKGGKFYKIEGDTYVIGYLEANGTILYHREHGKQIKGNDLRQAKLPDGIYEVRRGVEYVNDELKPIVD